MQQPDGSKTGLTGGCRWCVYVHSTSRRSQPVLPISRVRHTLCRMCECASPRTCKRLTRSLASSPLLLSLVTHQIYQVPLRDAMEGSLPCQRQARREGRPESHPRGHSQGHIGQSGPCFPIVVIYDLVADVWVPHRVTGLGDYARAAQGVRRQAVKGRPVAVRAL